MTDKEKQELYENVCNDISCGTFILVPQYVDKLLANLEKENAELNEKYVKECEDVAYVVTNYNKQLTKAKELIKKLLDEFERMDVLCNYQLRTQAEQFLKDSEVKK